MTKAQIIDTLRAEGYPVDDNPDLMDSIHSTSPHMEEETGRMQARYWELARDAALTVYIEE